jgi:hypothetical protein
MNKVSNLYGLLVIVMSMLSGFVPVFSQHLHRKGGMVFTPFDFQTIENFIYLNNPDDYLSRMSKPLNYFDPNTGFQFHYSANGHGRAAIRIADPHDSSVDYYLNYEMTTTSSGERRQVTVVTSHGDELTNHKVLRHFLQIVSEIKRAILAPKNFDLLYRYLDHNGKENFPLMWNCNALLFRHRHSTHRMIDVTPAGILSGDVTIPYHMDQRITHWRDKVRWHYRVPAGHKLADDYFFKHFTDLLLELRMTGSVYWVNERTK